MNNNSDCTIRAYSAADRTQLIKIMQLNVPEFFAEEEVSEFQEYLDTKTELYYVILSEDEIVGSGGINFADEGTVGKISWDILHPSFQKKGLGSKLLQHRIEALKKLNHVNKVIVRTSQVAHKFYEKHGFEVSEIVPDYWAAGFDLYYMELQKFRGSVTE